MKQDTTLAAYHQLEKVRNKQLSILQAIAVLHSACDYQIAAALKWPVNCVTGRRNELVSLGMVSPDCRKYNPATKRTVIHWKLTY